MPDLNDDQSLLLAEQLIRFGDLTGALALCAQMLEAMPDHPGARRLRGEIHLRSEGLAAYRINLDRRTDRLAECRENEARQGVPEGVIRRMSAVEDKAFGAVGCGKSHIAALTDFFLYSKAPYCMVLEDDFDFLQPAWAITETLAALEKAKAPWDVLLLDAIDITLLGEGPLPGLRQVLETHCTGGYLVSRPYVPKLLGCFFDAVAQMERFREVAVADKASSLEIRKRFAIDVSWRHLQRRDIWLMGAKPFGRQRPSFSDIEQDYTDLTGRGLQPA